MSNSNIFIGRTNQIEAFWKRYQELDENPEKEGEVYAISYYGMGGIGKTYLLKKIKEELEIQYKNPRYIQLELRSRSDGIDVLKKMKELLEEKYNYVFYNFGTAYNAYMKKLGIKANTSLKKGPGVLMSMALGIGKTIAELVIPGANHFITGAETYASVKGSHIELVKQMEAMEPEELFEKMPRFFAEDMEINLKKRDREKEPALIVFIDVYENFVNELDDRGNPLSADRWFYSVNGLLESIPGVFWVICGREELKWEEYNKNWKAVLSQFKLPKFTREEGEKYLIEAGFEQPGLREDIYTLTDGHPFYLSLCKKRLEELVKSGKEPEISMFGNSADELFDRLVRDMDSATQYLCYLLSAVGRWNDELIEGVISKESVIAYEKLKKISFVEETEDGFYIIGRTVSEILMSKCPEIISRDAGKLLVDTYLDGLKKRDFDSPDYSIRAAAVLRGYILTGKSRDEICELYRNNLKNMLVEFIEQRFHVVDFADFDSFLVFAMKKNDDLLYAEAMFLYSLYLYFRGKYVEAEKRMTSVPKLFEKLSAEDDESVMLVKSLMAAILEFNEDIPKALEMAEDVYNLKKDKYGENSPQMASPASNYASVLERAGKHKEALCYYEKAYTLSDINTENGWIYYNNYAYALHNAGKYNEALPIRKQVYDLWMARDQEHPYALYAIAGYADTLTRKDKAPEALIHYENVLAKVKEHELFEQNHSFVLDVKCSYAVALGKSENLPGALEIIDEVISKREETAGENHRDTLLAKHNKASMLFDAGDYPGAYEIQQELLNNHSDFFEQNKPQRLRAKSMMAVIKSNMDSAEMKNEAIAEQEAILAEYTSEYDYETNEMLEAMNFMGMVYSNCGEYKKAHEKLVEALAKYEAFYGAKHPLTRNIARGVVATLLNGIRSGKIVKTPFLKGREARVRRKYGV